MDKKIKDNTEKSVEDYLIKSIGYLNKDDRKGTKISSWIFNSVYGSYAFASNLPVPPEGKLTKEEVAEYHSERQSIKLMPKKFKSEGVNTMYVTLIPCDVCMKYLIDLDFKINIVFFVDKHKKMEKQTYKDFAKEINIAKYVNNGTSEKSIKINNMIKEMAGYTNGNTWDRRNKKNKK